MKPVLRFFGFSIRAIIGLLFYAFSKEFRAMIAYKMAQQRGSNERVAGGEEVTAVLHTPQGKQVI